MKNSDSTTRYRSDQAKNLVSFLVGDVRYAVDIHLVREIVNPLPFVTLPHAPEEVCGVADHRGEVLPIVDLRVRFGLPAADFNAVTVTIVMSLVTESGIKEHGFVVDSVRDVVDLTPDSIKPAPEVGGVQGHEYIEAIATHDEQMLILLNAAMLAPREQSSTEAAEQAA